MFQFLDALIQLWAWFSAAALDWPRHFFSGAFWGFGTLGTTWIISRVLYRFCSPRFMERLRTSRLGICIDLSLWVLALLVSSWRHQVLDGLW
jgi:hypothetical protein